LAAVQGHPDPPEATDSQLMPNSLSSAIASLYNSQAEVRALAAAEIYRQGRAQAKRAVLPWFQNTELAGLLLSPGPIVTVGLAVAHETFELIRKANGQPELARVPPDQDAEEFELHFGAGVELDVLTSKDPSGGGAIARFLSRFGEGIQQVEFYCRDVNRAATKLREHFGVTAI